MKTSQLEKMNLYINWLLYAVVGRMAEADGLLEEFKSEIYEVAAWLQELYPVALEPVWRGILLEKHQVQEQSVRPDARLQFLSFTRDHAVARWFADPCSIMSSYVKQQRPGVEGYIANFVPKASDILFDAEWAKRGILSTFLVEAARLHPFINNEQFCWNMQTQSEVIVKPPGSLFVKLYEATETKALDEKYCLPRFLYQEG